MLRNRLIGVSLVTFVAIGPAIVAAPGQVRSPAAPPDLAKVKVTNTGRTDAVPVSIQELALPLVQNGPPMKVEVTGKPTVVVDPMTTVLVKVIPRSWEYKSIRIPNWDDASSLLNSEGAQGWETTGVMFSAPGGTTLVLKRQK
jgi:hypothetical protein